MSRRAEASCEPTERQARARIGAPGRRLPSHSRCSSGPLGLIEVGPVELGVEWALRVFDPGGRAIASHALSAYVELTLPA